MHFWNRGGFVFCRDGYAEIKINEQYYVLTPGSILVVTPLIQIYSFEPSEDYEEVSFLDELKMFYPVFHQIIDTGMPLKVRENPIWKISEKEISFVMHNHSELNIRYELLKDNDEGKRLIEMQIKLIKQLSIIEIIRNRMKKMEWSGEDQRRQPMVAYNFIMSLHENYRQHRSVGWYSDQANLSRGHFTATIKKMTGMSPSRLIEIITTTYVKMMLEMTDMSIKEIAVDFNFPEQFTFRKYFKQHTGMSPKEYRIFIKSKSAD